MTSIDSSIEVQRMATVTNASRETGLPKMVIRRLVDDDLVTGFKVNSWLYVNMNSLHSYLQERHTIEKKSRKSH